MSFEEQLRQALRPGPVPRGLADRVLAQLAAASAGGDQPLAAGQAAPGTSEAGGTGAAPRAASAGTPRRPSWLGLGVAASLLAAVTSGALWLEHDRQRQAREARDQVLRALAITSEQLHDIQARVSTAPARSGD